MEPTDNLSGGHCSRSGDYGCPAWTFDQEQAEDLMSSLFLLSESQSPQPSSLWLSENFGDVGLISPLDEGEMPCIPAAVAEETNYAAAAPVAPLVATHGTGPGQFPFNISMSSTTSDQFDEEEVQQLTKSLEPLLHPPNHILPVGIYIDELPHPQQQLPLVEEVQIQQMMSTILPPQPPSPTPVLNPAGLDKSNYDALAPMGLQGTIILAAPQYHQEANILSRASARRRLIKSKGLPSRVGSGNLFDMVIDMIRQFGRHIGKMMKEEKRRSRVWEHFWSSHCQHCGTFTVICQYCNTFMRNHYSTIEMLKHNNIHLLPASSGASKETGRSSQAQIKEIAPNSESETIETDNNICAAAVPVDMQGTNAVVLSPLQQHQQLMDREEQMATILSSQPCCQGRPVPLDRPLLSSGYRNYINKSGIHKVRYSLENMSGLDLYFRLEDEQMHESLWDLIIRLSDSSYCSSTTQSTHDAFRLEFSNDKESGCELVHVHSSAAWVHVSEKNPPGVSLETNSYNIRGSYVSMGVRGKYWKSVRALECAHPWKCLQHVLCSLGFKKEFATHSVIYALGWVNGCNLRLRSPCCSSGKGKSIVVAQGDDVPSGKRKRKPAPPRSKVWNHFTKEVVEAVGSKVTMAKCNYCPSELKADSASHGTTHLKRHIRSIHPEHAKSL